MSTPPVEATKWSELSVQQKKSGLAAWLGWFFDGLDLHLYTLVAAVFVAELLHTAEGDHRRRLVRVDHPGGFPARVGVRRGRLSVWSETGSAGAAPWC